MPNARRVSPEVLVNEDIPEPADLRSGDLRVRTGDHRRRAVCRFPDDLEVAFDGVLGHVDEVGLVASPIQPMYRRHLSIASKMSTMH